MNYKNRTKVAFTFFGMVIIFVLVCLFIPNKLERDLSLEAKAIENIQRNDFLMLTDSTLVRANRVFDSGIYVIEKTNNMYEVEKWQIIEITKKDSVQQWYEKALQFFEEKDL